MHASPAPHVLPQPPQLEGSVSKSAHPDGLLAHGLPRAQPPSGPLNRGLQCHIKTTNSASKSFFKVLEVLPQVLGETCIRSAVVTERADSFRDVSAIR
jgi:hypothetical protein